ncbi:MAG: hypothetical protein WC494_00660 [Candidatus Pacearchaeota archaeon]
MTIEKVIKRLKETTSKYGVAQHSKGEKKDFSVPFSIDDTARAEIFLSRVSNRTKVPVLSDIFIRNLYESKRADGWFENYRMLNGEFGKRGVRDNPSSLQDCYGRVLWALTEYSHSTYSDRDSARNFFLNSLQNTEAVDHPMGLALLGIALSKYTSEKGQSKIRLLANRVGKELERRFMDNSTEDWKGFGNEYTYCVARIPQSMILLGKKLGLEEYKKMGLLSLDFLIQNLFDFEGVFHAVGNGNPATNPTETQWFRKGFERAVYDEQTIEAGVMVEACRDAYLNTGDKRYLNYMNYAFNWFLGKNSAKMRMIKESGAVYDAITGPDSVNKNCGAESLLSYGLALSCIPVEKFKSVCLSP